MFLELMSRLIAGRAQRTTSTFRWVAGTWLTTMRSITSSHRSIFSFDMNANEVERQKFNRPTGKTICVAMNSADLPAKIDTIFQIFPRKQNIIVWLDYTNTNRRAQFQEAVQTLVRLRHGDIFRITLNADIRNLGRRNEWKDKGAASPAEYRVEKLRAEISEYLPTNITEILDADLPPFLLGVWASLPAPPSTAAHSSVYPVLITSYSDGTRMLTVTCVVSESDKEDKFPGSDFRRWKFACRGWTDLQMIYAPILSLREQYRLDINTHRGAKRMLSSFKFLPAADEATSLQALESYKLFIDTTHIPKHRRLRDYFNASHGWSGSVAVCRDMSRYPRRNVHREKQRSSRGNL